jgi:dihydrofolate reductase
MRDALRIVEREHKATEAFIAGGGEVYETALDTNVVDRMLLTIVHASVEADVFFPYFEAQAWTERWAVYYPADVENDHSFTITMLEKDERVVQGSSASSLEKNA